MEKRSPTLREKIAKLRRSFLEKLPATLADAERLAAQLAVNPSAKAPLDDLYRVFHSIKGSSASFGLTEISAVGAAGEEVVAAFRDRGDVEALQSGLAAVIARVGAAHRDALDEQGETVAGTGFDMTQAAEAAGLPRRRVYLCDDDELAAEHLATQLACFGYKVVPFHSPNALRSAVIASPPDAVIMDIVFPGRSNAGTDIIAAMREDVRAPMPVIFVSARRDFEARLRAVQSGGHAYFVKPVKAIELIETLDALTTRQEPEPYRILVVDDEPEVGEYHGLILEEAGMTTRILSEPDAILDVLADFNPDLVLMDMYMPRCSGHELSQLIRQIPDFLSLPIVFLSSETNKIKQVSALRVGAEGFLTKPIQPEDLISAVAIRAERMRTLRSLMVRDSLTGLFNHTFMSQYLESMISGINRDGGQLSFAMIDVDHFKAVNDTFGHPAGDQVLVALARMLQQRLRHSDTVARYGGEEFGIIMQGVDPLQAKAILDQLREDFSRVRFHAGDRDFACTFSGGVAGVPAPSASALMEAADQMLYASKHGGRNRITVAKEMAA